MRRARTSRPPSLRFPPLPDGHPPTSLLTFCVTLVIAIVLVASVSSATIAALESAGSSAAARITIWDSARYVRHDGKPPGISLLVVSAGGSGSSALMDTLTVQLRRRGVRVNDVNDEDGLKHARYSDVSRGAIAAFNPTLILYLLPSPLVSIASHFRRGWPGAQLCKLRGQDAAGRELTGGLLAALAPVQRGANGSVPLATFAALAAARGVDYFGFEEHAASWLRAPELGFTVWFARLADVVEQQGILAALLGLGEDAAPPLFRFPLRNATPPALRLAGGAGLPTAFLELYAGVEERLVRRFRGRCAAPLPPQTGAASASNTSTPPPCAGHLPLLPDSAPSNATLIRQHAHVWATRAALVFSWQAYVHGHAGPCRGLLRPPTTAPPAATAPAAEQLRRHQLQRRRPAT